MILLDVEIFPNYFLLGVEDFTTKEKFCFEINRNRNDLHSLILYLKQKQDYIVTFNGEHYDLPVLAWIVQNYEELYGMESLDVTKKIKEFSDLIISDADPMAVYKYKYQFKDQWKHIDLFLYWSKLLRVSKKISLKGLAVQMNYPEIQELPYPHNKVLTNEEITEVKRYNLVNDLGILRCLLVEKAEDVRLRKEVHTNYKIECFSMDAIKIASEYLLNEYCKKTGFDKKDVRNQRFAKKDFLIKEYVPNFNFKTKYFQELYKEIINSDSTFSKTFVYETKPDTYIKISMGIGGIHSILQDTKFVSDDTYLIVTSDIALTQWGN